jgi:hypothetical protein
MLCELEPLPRQTESELPLAAVRHLGSAPLGAGPGWQLAGQDGGQTIDLGDDTLFVFSDTLLRLQAGGQLLLANCAARASGRRLPEALAGLRYYADARGLPRRILCATAAESARRVRLWPAHGALVGGRVYLFYLGIEFFNPRSAWGFRNLGSGLAVLDPETGEALRLRRGTDWCLWKAHGDDFHFGVQTLRAGEWLYVYSSTRHGYHSQAGIARVPAARVGEPDAYGFLDGSGGWSARAADAVSLGPAGNDFSVSYDAYLGRYLMVFVDAYDKRLLLRHAPEPWGPWSPPQVACALPHQPGSELIFLGLEHPRFAEDGGRTVYITYGQPHFVQNSLVSLTFA